MTEEERMHEILLTDEEATNCAAAIDKLVAEAWDNANEHGFHNDYYALKVNCFKDKLGERNFYLASLAKIASEVGEAVAEIQHDRFAEALVEVADIVIRCFDLAGVMGGDYGDLGEEIIKKMIYNRTRPYLHGKKC